MPGNSGPLTRLVDHAKAHLVVVPVGDVGPLIAAGAITVNGRVGKIADPVRAADPIVVAPDALAAVALVPDEVPLVIRHEDDELVIVDKPAGMHVHPLGAHRTGTLLNALLWHCGARADQPWAAWRPSPLHRLDRAASGLVAFAKTAAIHDVKGRLFEGNGNSPGQPGIGGGHSPTVPGPWQMPSCPRLCSGPPGGHSPTAEPIQAMPPANRSCTGVAQANTAWNIRNITTARITRPSTGCSSQRSRRSSRPSVRAIPRSPGNMGRSPSWGPSTGAFAV